MKKLSCFICVIILLGCCVSLWAAGIPEIRIGLAEAEEMSLAGSDRYKAALNELEAAKKKADAALSNLYPKLSLEGSYKYSEVVTEIEPVKGVKPVKMGDNVNYSIGPSLTYALWESGASKNSWTAALAAAKAKEYEAENVKRQIILSCRNAYFQSAHAAEQVVLLADGCLLAQKQYDDIRINVKAGTKARMDELSSHQELLSRKRQLSQARADLASSLRDLSALTGRDYGELLRSPSDWKASARMPQGLSEPTASVVLDGLDSLMERFKKYRGASVTAANPAVAVYKALSDSFSAAAASAGAANMPRLYLSARTSIDYPNGPKLESFNQNTAGVTLSWTMFDAAQARSRVRENKAYMGLNLSRMGQALTDLGRDLNKTMDRISALEEQKELTSQTVKEADALASIIYTSYKNGSLTYIEVQNANYKALEAKIALAKIKVQMLMNYAGLACLAD